MPDDYDEEFEEELPIPILETRYRPPKKVKQTTARLKRGRPPTFRRGGRASAAAGLYLDDEDEAEVVPDEVLTRNPRFASSEMAIVYYLGKGLDVPNSRIREMLEQVPGAINAKDPAQYLFLALDRMSKKFLGKPVVDSWDPDDPLPIQQLDLIILEIDQLMEE